MPRRALLQHALIATAWLVGCVDAGSHYDDFLARADRTPPELADAGLAGVLTDVTGDYLLNIALKPLGDVFLKLRLTFTSFELDGAGHEGTVVGEFRFHDETLEDSPLATFETTLDVNGRMVIDVGRVRIEADRSPIEDTAVEAEFVLDVIMLDELSMCGFISDERSVVIEPIQLDLLGTTFGAQRFGPQGELPTDVPTECPFGPGDGADPEPDAGAPDGGDGGEDDLRPPDVDLGAGTRADVTGRFWMKVAIGGAALTLDLLADLEYFEGAEAASIDGVLRSVTAEPGEPALASFSESVDDNGEFTVIVRGLSTPSPLGEVVADIALRGIIRDADTLCGAAAGTVYSPLQLDLAGTTFGLVRIEPDSAEEPDNAIDGCP